MNNMTAYMKYINIISRCAAQYRNERLENSDLNGSQCTYILNICKNPGISQDELADMIYINKSNVTRQLAALEENGYITRNLCETDRRVTEVYPTQKALDILPHIRELLRTWNEYITSDLTEEEKQQFFTLLERIADKAKLYVKNAGKKKNTL
jgi:MarR family transcriptional regulator for hemolysin